MSEAGIFSKTVALAEKQNERVRILLVDDEKSILSSLTQLLAINYEEYLIGTAQSAEEALALANLASVDVLITDLRLPQMDGLDLIKAVRERSPKTRMLLITAYATEKIIEQAQKNGCNAFLQKPLDVDLLFEFIDEALIPRPRVTLGATNFSLADVVRFYAGAKADSILVASAEGRDGLLIIEKGLLVHAQFGEHEGAAALLELMDQPELQVQSLNCQFSGTKTLAVTWLALQTAFEAGSAEDRLALLSKPARVRDREAVDSAPDDSSSPSPEDTREARNTVARLVQTGIDHFRAKKLREAKQCWLEAIEMDPGCSQARENLRVLESLVRRRESMTH